MNTTEILQTILLTPQAASNEEALKILKGVKGRGKNQYGYRLRDWLENNKILFNEPINVEYLESIHEHGVDVLLTGNTTKTRIGFQIKSDNDLKKSDFTQKLKAQITDAQTLGINYLIVLLACRPTDRNQQKYSYMQNEVNRWPNNTVQIIEPSRAAGLFKVFKLKLNKLDIGEKNWKEFFIKAGQNNLASLYLDSWIGGFPNERYQPPEEYQEILNSISKYSVTFIIGAPAVGKTFTILNILWNNYLNGRDIKWIGANEYHLTEGPISNEYALPGMKQRIDILTRNLGLKSNLPPLDATDFIAANLLPNSILYIEDPFGKTKDEFEYSLHSYSFFDLNQFISAISKGSPRANCRILISSREGLFEKWQYESRKKKISNSNVNVINLSKFSYKYKQLHKISEILLGLKKCRHDKEICDIFAYSLELPYEIEFIIKDLKKNTNISQIKSKINEYRSGLINRISNYLKPKNDAERLFLILLDAFSTNGHGRIDYQKCYVALFKKLGLPGNCLICLNKIMTKYNPYFKKLKVIKTLHLKNPVYTYHLESAHSVIKDAIRNNIKRREMIFIKKLINKISDFKEKYDMYENKEIAIYLLKIGIKRNNKMMNTLVNIILKNKYFMTKEAYALLKSWNYYNDKLKTCIFNYIATNNKFPINYICNILPSSDIKKEDAWKFIDIALERTTLSTDKFNIFGHPLLYICINIKNIPEKINKKLNRLLNNEPIRFFYGFGDLMVLFWQKIPEKWRNKIFNKNVLSNYLVQEKLLYSIGRYWKNAPSIMKKLFMEQINHVNYRIRACVGLNALLFYEGSPKIFKKLLKRSINDKDIRVALFILQEGLGDDTHDNMFVNSIFEKSDKIIASCILNNLLYSNSDFKKTRWKKNLALKCINKGGEYSRAVSYYHSIINKSKYHILGIKLRPFGKNENMITKLAFIWAYVYKDEEQNTGNTEKVVKILHELKGMYRDYALYYLSLKANSLPGKIKAYLDKNEKHYKAIKNGKKDREAKNSDSKSLWGFPISAFIKD